MHCIFFLHHYHQLSEHIFIVLIEIDSPCCIVNISWDAKYLSNYSFYIIFLLCFVECVKLLLSINSYASKLWIILLYLIEHYLRILIGLLSDLMSNNLMYVRSAAFYYILHIGHISFADLS